MLYGHIDMISSTGEIKNKIIESDYNNLEIFDFNVILLDHMIGNPAASIIHKSTFEEYGTYDESRKIPEDYELWLRLCLLHNCRLHLVPKTVAKYRIHSSQITISTRKERLKNITQMKNFALEKLNPKDRLLYEKALLRYKKTKPLILRFGFFIRNNIIFNLPIPISNRIMMFVRSLSDGHKKRLGLDFR